MQSMWLGDKLPGAMPYLIAVGVTAVMAMLRMLLESVLDGNSPVLVFTVAVLVSAYFGGIGPGLLATALSLVLAVWLFIEPDVFWPTSTAEQVRILLFALTGVAISAICERLRRLEQRALQNQTELKKTVAMMQSLLDNAPVGIAFFDRQHRYVRINKHLCQMNGLPEEAHLGKSIAQVLPENSQSVDPLLDRLFAQPRTEEVEIAGRTPRHPDEQRHWLTGWYPVPMPDGQILIGAVVMEITERKQAQELLRRGHDTFYQLVQNNPFGVYVVDADFKLRQVSLGAQKVFGTVRPLLGRDFAEVLRIIWPEPFASEAIGRFRHTLETGEPYSAPSTVERRADISEVEAYDWRIERIVLPDGRFGVVCYFYDLSERQQWEAKLATAKLSAEQAKAIAEDASRAKDHFLAVLSHELRTPLTPDVCTTFCPCFAGDGRAADGEATVTLVDGKEPWSF